MSIPYAGAALQRYSHRKVPEKYAANSQENTHAKVRPQQSHCAALLKSHTNVGSLPQIHLTNLPKHPPIRAPPKDCICVYSKIQINSK